MVFESLVVDVLNRFLGDYVVNLDSSQLKLGIWGGAVALNNLEIKENALSQLDVPFKVKVGHIGQLNLQIPWQNLYTQPVEAVLDGVYLLIVPTASIKYDAEKEARQFLEARQRELQRIEEAKQKIANQDKVKEEKQDTFVEKLVTQVIKNLQLKISNIHIRYEDDITNRNNPLSFGISLQNLSLQTSDKNWNPCLHDETAKLFYKLVRLDNLFAYWNVQSEMFYHGGFDESLVNLKQGVASHSVIPEGYDFVFRPISARAKLLMNPRSDVDFSSPKMDLDVNLQDITVEFNKPQYLSVMELLESIDMMTRNLPYRKYRPDVPLHNNAKTWWQYVIYGILEVNVQPKLQMWSWEHIRHHRKQVKNYKEMYKKKITSRKPDEEILKLLEELEKALDVFNITLARQQAEVEATKAGLKIYRPGVKQADENSGGWFSWIWSWSGEKKDEKKQEIKGSSLEELMTQEEKAKLYAAIGYSETAVDPTLPKSYEAMKFSVKLLSMSVSIRENRQTPKLVEFALTGLSTVFTQRPGAQAVRFESKITSLEVTGMSREKCTPCLLSSRTAYSDESTSLLSIMFETNPLDEKADQKLRIESQPLEIVYDAMTVNNLVDFFRPPKDVSLEQLTSATRMKLEEFREKTSTGLMYVIETQKVLDLKINLMASYIIVPQRGFYDNTSNLLLLDLGSVKMTSKNRSDLSELKVGQSTIEDIMSRAYDSFDIQLSSIHLLYSKHDENWQEARKLKNSSQCILQPLDVNMEFSRAMVVTDARMPKFKLSGQMPLLSIQVSDQKLTSILELIHSIPKPKSVPATSSPPKPAEAGISPVLSAPHLSQGMFSALDLHSFPESESEEEFYDALSSPMEEVTFFEAPSVSLKQAGSSTRQKRLRKQESLKNMTEFQLRFEVAEVLVKLCHCTDNTEMPVLQLDILGLGTELKLRTFDMTANAFLREVCLLCPEYMDDNDKPVYIITTLDNVEDDLLTLEYIKTDINGPELKTTYQNVLQKIKVNFSSLDVHLHTEALLNAMNYLNNLLPKQETKVAEVPEKIEEKKDVLKKLTSKKLKYEDVIDLNICADLSCLSIFIREKKHRIAEIHIEGLDSQVIMRKTATEVTAKLKNIVILDSDETALYKKALYITEKEVFNFRMISYVNATGGVAYSNMDVVDNRIYLTVGCIQVLFVNKFVSSILAFINNFQAAKEALTEATVQAAEKAATGVKERSSRLALDINIKAPVVIIPQSATSENVLVADLGLITVKNQFFIPKTRMCYNLPPVIDSMTVKLSELKLYRSCYEQGSLQTEVQLLQPVNLEVAVERNLAAAWYNEVPDIEISGRLKPMNLILSQEDITTILRTLNENTGESSGASTSFPEPKESTRHCSDMHSTSQHSAGVTVVTSAVVELHSPVLIKTTLKLDFKFDSLTLVLYSPNSKKVTTLDQRDDLLKLAELKLVLMSAALKMLSDGSMNASVKLTNCTLDDKRQSIQKATPRMVEMKRGFEKKVMVDISYKQGRDGTVLDVIVQEIYLCASMEFLLTVADIFLKANAESAAAQRNLKQSLPLKDQAPVQPVSTMEMNIVVKNPEIVFVADLTRSDAPALVATTQCEVFIKNSPERYNMTAAVKDIQMKACPFLPEKRNGNITTVLQPCDFFFEMKQSGTNPQTADLMIKSLTLKVSPIIINTVITITSALYQTAETTEEEISQIPPDLWNKKDIKNLNMWFLEETSENEDKNTTTELVPTGESLKINIESVFLTLEAGVGHRTVPMLLAKSSFVGEVKNWSTLINLRSCLELEVHYFNEMFGVWEPLLEPLEVEKTDLFKPWILEIKMKKAKKMLLESDDEDEENYKVPEYKTVINVSSKDQLNITLSKCGLQMLSNLGTAFAEAASQTSDIFKKDRAPFVIINSLGLPIMVLPSDAFSVLDAEFGAKIFHLKDGENLNMEFVRTKNESDQFTAMTTLSSKRFYIQICPHNHSTVEKIPLTKVGRCIYRVRHEESGVERSIVCQIDTVEGSKMITIRSPIQIRNHFSIPLNVFEEGRCLGTASPGNEFNIPFSSYRSILSLQPLANEDEANGEYDMCEGITFDDIIKNVDSLLQRKCQSVGSTNHSLIISIVPVKDSLTSSLCAEDQWDFPYVVHLWPSVLLHNLLPYLITFSVEGNGNKYVTLQEGSSAQIHNAVLDQTKLNLQLLNYLDQNWKSEYHIKSDLPDISFTTFYCITELDKTELDIAVHVTYTTGQMVIAIHSPYWMVNKTGRMLQYKADGIHRKHPPDYKKPLLFSFQPKNFLQNNKVQLRVTDSELSDHFSLDTVGSHGSVKCKSHKKEYQVGVTINNSSFNITRIVTFTPFFMISNRSKYTLEVAEEGKEKWIPIVLQQWCEKQWERELSGMCIPFWPENDANKLLVRVENSDLPPKKINFDQQENCLLLHLDNKLGGITVDVNLTEHSTVITFSDYHDGAAPFLLINHTNDEIIEYGQSSLSELEDCLQPNKAVLYTWADPAGSRKLTWKCGNRTEEISPKEDKMEILRVDCRKAVYLMSFYEGLQRIVLITEDENVFKLTYESVKAELAEQEIILSLQDVGISLVDNYLKQEVSYIGITSSDVVWETKPKKKSRWRPMSVKQIDKLEQEFKDYSELSPSENKIIELESNVLVCLTPNGMDMKIQQPNEIPIRRNYLPALKVEYSSSAHQKSFRIQIYRIQIQNQIPGAIFPFVFYPIKPPKSITLDSAPKPFTDVSIVMRTAGHSQISHIKYFKVLIQEMDLRLDLGFLYALVALFTRTDLPSDPEIQHFKKDVECLQEELMSVSSMDTSQISLYEYFHISPIKLHLSFSLSTGGEDSNKEERKNELIPLQSLNLLLKSIGATLTDVQDIVFKLSFFELRYHFCTTQQLQSAVVKHYSKQAIKQMYVLILGLDVLGNPFGFIRGLSEGVEAFFYEPYQGAIQGPEEFIEGMALGLKALVGGAVGGLAGAASRITGAMAKGVAAITMDEDYQQKRREAMNKQPTGLREGITRGGKGLVSGFVSGITGIVTKPIRGAQEEGAAGFFKGVGKGLVGAVARPTGGIIDMASSTFQGIKKVADSSEDVISLRPPRFFGEDGVIRPYRLRDGTGSQMLQKIENGRFAKLRYIAHAMVNSTDLLMVTKSGVLFVTKGTFGQLICEWQYTYDEFTKEPFIVDGRRLRIEAKERVKSVFHAKEFGKIINFRSPEDAKWILSKLEEVRENQSKL
ncbi:vacuolar protein sorting-associated protein 13A isoform X1 [Neopelma chrysocephalum]|uniref:vacuolar protein sorting-associated protein 13A isoform X1 n=1 Tax=Neopelma chrysocephalum TaxID=114329 RepID=UPI000FCD1B72|nr:vacuolar protein sorting-associated protein 13A isoform X1 [Neopelma chrysocephalum]